MSYYVIIPYSYIMRMLYENEVFLLLVVFGVGTQQPGSIQGKNSKLFKANIGGLEKFTHIIIVHADIHTFCD